MSRKPHRRSKRCFYGRPGTIPSEIPDKSPEWTRRASEGLQIKAIGELKGFGFSLKQSSRVEYNSSTFEHHLGVGCLVLDQEDFAEPSFAYNLEDVELIHEVHL